MRCPDSATLWALDAGELSSEESAGLLAHSRSCDACQASRRQVKASLQFLSLATAPTVSFNKADAAVDEAVSRALLGKTKPRWQFALVPALVAAGLAAFVLLPKPPAASLKPIVAEVKNPPAPIAVKPVEKVVVAETEPKPSPLKQHKRRTQSGEVAISDTAVLVQHAEQSHSVTEGESAKFERPKKSEDALPTSTEALFLRRADASIKSGQCGSFLLGLETLAFDAEDPDVRAHARITKARCHDERLEPNKAAAEYARYLRDFPEGPSADEARKALAAQK